MTNIRKHLLFTVATAMLLYALGIGVVKSNPGNRSIIADHLLYELRGIGTDINIEYSVAQAYQSISMAIRMGISSDDTFAKSPLFRESNASIPIKQFAQLSSDLRAKSFSGFILLAAQGLQRNTDTDPTAIERFVTRFQEATFKVKVLVVILIYMVVSVLVLFVSIVINRQVKEIKRKKKLELKDEYQEQLASFLFDEETDKIELRGVNKKLNRQIFIDELMDLHNNLHGEAADRLKDLYFNLGLHRDSLRKVYKGRWDKKAKGFKELAQMDVKDANEQIQKYTNHKNPILRMESQVAMVKLAEDNPLSFLNDLTSVLSYWEQVNIHNTLLYHQINIDSFDEWLNSSNASVVVFALRMISLFKHTHSAGQVRELLFNDNAGVSLEAVKTMHALELPDHVKDLKTLYESETLNLDAIVKEQRKSNTDRDIEGLDDLMPRRIRYEIVKAIGPVASQNDISFLEKVAQDFNNTFKLRILAIQILMSVKPHGEQRLNQILEGNNDELIKKMIINVKQNQES